MVMPRHPNHFFEFGAFRLEPEKHRLLRNGEPVHLSPKSSEALVVLVKNAGKLLEREELIQAVWADTFVEDANLTVAISHLRKALGQNGDTAEYIETIPRVGYRFVAEVRERYEEPTPVIIEKHTQSRTVIEEEFLPDTTVTSSEQLTVEQSLSVAKRILKKTSLRQVAVAVVLLLFVGTGSLVYLRRGHTDSSTNSPLGVKSLAVLPPRSLGNEIETASIRLGVADALITRLGSIRNLTVRSTSAVARYVDTDQDALSAGRALNVDAVLDGTMQNDRGRTRLTLRLLNVMTGDQIWAGSFDEAEGDIFKLQDSISQHVAQALSPNLTASQKALLAKRQTTNPEAYAQYLKGTYFWNKRGPEAAKSVEYLRRAIELDPNFAQAYVTLAAVDATTVAVPSPETEALLDKALKLDDSLAEAHATLGLIKMFHYWDWPAAERELDRALELDPNSAVAHHWKGVYLSIQGRLDEAKVEMHRALELDPLSLIIMADIGQLHYFAREYDQAIDYCNRVLSFDPDFWVAHEYLLDIYSAKGMGREALNEMTKLQYPQSPEHLRETFNRGGLNAVYTDLLNYWLHREDSTQEAIVIAKLYSRLGDREHAVTWLDRSSTASKVFWIAYINVDPLYHPLRNDPRFTEILKRMRLEI